MLKRMTYLSLILFASLGLSAAPREPHSERASSTTEAKAEESRRLRPHVTFKKMPATEAARVRASLKWQGGPAAGSAGAVATRVRSSAGGVSAEVVPVAPEVAVAVVNPDGTLTTTCASPQEAAAAMKSARERKDDGSRQ